MNISIKKEDIKNRMLKKASEIWGVPASDIESTFDPVVSLLIGACASEISEIMSEANSSHVRVAENLISLMTPEASTGVTPAHAIAHVSPTENEALLKSTYQFYAKNRVTGNKGDIHYETAFFSAIQDVKLTKAHIQYIVVDKHLCILEPNSKTKTTYTIPKLSSSTNNTRIYIGIPKTEEKISLKDTQLFFEIDDYKNHSFFYDQLKKISLSFNGKLVRLENGFKSSIKQDTRYLERIFSDLSTKTVNTEKLVEDFYNRHFITLEDHIFLNEDSTTPPDLKNSLNDIDDIEIEHIHWLTIDFPNALDNNIFNTLFTSLNCFPVLNRKLESITFTLKDYHNIVPILVKDLFLGISEITNEQGQKYTSIEGGGENRKGTFSIKKNDIGRLDTKKAQDYLIHLIDLLRNESAAFSNFGNDFLNDMAAKLNQDIALLESKVLDVDLEVSEKKYLEVNPFNEKEILYIDYWTTIGNGANNIRSNTPLFVYKGVDLDAKSCFLITNSIGGKKNLSTQENIYKYRNTLLSNNRVVTKTDIKNLCFEVAGDKLHKVTLEKRLETTTNYLEGLVPTFVIQLYKNTNVNSSLNEWELIESNILTLLKEQSHNILPYKIEFLD